MISTDVNTLNSAKDVKVVGRRKGVAKGFSEVNAFLNLVITLRGKRPFIPRGVHRFSSFQESQEWSIRMMARNSEVVKEKKDRENLDFLGDAV